VCLVPCLRRGVPFPDVFRPQPRSPGRRVRCYRTVNGACSRRNVFPSCSARRARVTNAFPRLAQEHHTRSRHTQPRADVFPGGVFSQAVQLRRRPPVPGFAHARVSASHAFATLFHTNVD
jgi:hypothetical protein